MEKNHFLKTFFVVIVTALITFLVTYTVVKGNQATESGETDFASLYSEAEYKMKFNEIKKKIAEEYVGDIDDNVIKEYMLKGYVAGLEDKYSTYYTKKEMDQILEDMKSNYVGVGVYIVKDTEKNKVKIYGVIDGSPAQEVGIQKDDFIVGVDGKEYTGDDFDTISDDIMGEIGTEVKLVIERNGERMEFTATRRKIEIKSVTSTVFENNIGYMYLSTFDKENVSEQFKNEFLTLKDQGITSLIVDVRNNGGGILEEATKIGDLFVDPGEELVIEENKSGEKNIHYSTNQKIIDMPIVLLVNDYSASASELFAGILRDKVPNCKIVGETTYGKGVVQSLYTLYDGSGLKITTSEYFSPNHTKINEVGITPDYVVDDYDFMYTLDVEKDTQFKKALELLKQN